ncbi:MAG TPA: iron ABC transporter permease [Archaeoglobus profundus]|nr:iron ABC transporter permease [Archaeoglobus profundus]
MVRAEYIKRVKVKLLFIFLLILLTFISAGIAITLGSYKVEFLDVYKIIFKCLFSKPENVQEAVIWELRLPRVLGAIVVGSSLSLAGAMVQGVLRNPLATPYTLGISSAAALGAAFAILYLSPFLVIPLAFLFSLIPIFIILSISKIKGATPETMILSGIAMLYIFSAVTTLLMYFANPHDVKTVYFWMVGDLSRITWNNLPIMATILIICFILLLLKVWDVNVLMAVGDENAKSIGVDPERTRIGTMLISSFLTASMVSFTGTIGFVCLVAPHICRILIGGDYRFLLPASTVFGGLLLLGCDTIARTIIAPVVLPVGTITNCLGGPMFLYLLIRRRREYW